MKLNPAAAHPTASGIFSKHASDHPRTVWCQQHNTDKTHKLSLMVLIKVKILPEGCIKTVPQLPLQPCSHRAHSLTFYIPATQNCVCFFTCLPPPPEVLHVLLLQPLDIVTPGKWSFPWQPCWVDSPRTCPLQPCHTCHFPFTCEIYRQRPHLGLHQGQNGLISTWMAYMCFLSSERGPLLW